MQGKSSPSSSPMSSISLPGVCAAGVNAATADCSSYHLKDPSPATPGAPPAEGEKQGRRQPRRSCLKSRNKAKPEHPRTTRQAPSAKGIIEAARLTSTQDDSGAVPKDEAADTGPATSGVAAEARKNTQGQTEAQRAGNSLKVVALASNADTSGRPARATNRAEAQAAKGRPQFRSDDTEDPRGIGGEALTPYATCMLDTLLSDFRSVAHVFRKKERSLLATAEDTVRTSDELDCNAFAKMPGRLSPLRPELLSGFSTPARGHNSRSGSFERRGGVHFACFAALTAAGSFLLLLLIYSLRGLRAHALQSGESRGRRQGNGSSTAVG